MSTVEIVRFEVPPERADELVAGHERARLAMDRLAPGGWIWSRLARFDERRWIEVVGWRERAAFRRTFELAPDDPVVGAWFGLADPDWTIVLGEAVESSASEPPKAGTMELVTAGTGDHSALVATPDEGSAWSMLTELDGMVWRGDSWERATPGMLRMTVPAPDRGPAPPSWTEVATIAHSFDAPTPVESA